jgi:pyrimidine operon attenuation protein/uracil phosphoribosyltransferase
MGKVMELLDSSKTNILIEELTKRIIDSSKSFENIAIIGIKRRGAILADRIKKNINKSIKFDIISGYLDITLYRDDLSEVSDIPFLQGTEVNFDVKNKIIVLVDDVIFTGRTIRAGLDAIIDLGRPKKILLAVLVDRNHRELPIQPDFVGKFFKTGDNEIINVNLKELDGVDSVTLSYKGGNV